MVAMLSRSMGAVSCLLLSSTFLLAADVQQLIKPGDTVIVSGVAAKLVAGSRILAELPKGTHIQVVAVRDDWIGGRANVEGEIRQGWVRKSEVAFSKHSQTGQSPTETVYHYRPGARHPYPGAMPVSEKIQVKGGEVTVLDGGNLAFIKPPNGAASIFPDALGSRDIRIVVDENLGFTGFAGLKFADNCTVNIWKDGAIELDKEGVEATDLAGAQYVSRRRRFQGRTAIVMVATSQEAKPTEQSPRTSSNVIKWLPLLMDARFASHRAEVERPFLRQQAQASTLTADDYRSIVATATRMKASLQRSRERRETADHRVAQAFLDRLIGEAEERLQKIEQAAIADKRDAASRTATRGTTEEPQTSKATDANTREPAGTSIEPGDTVVAWRPTPVMKGKEELTLVEKGTRLVATAVRGNWVGVRGQKGGKPVVGWVDAGAIVRGDDLLRAIDGLTTARQALGPERVQMQLVCVMCAGRIAGVEEGRIYELATTWDYVFEHKTSRQLKNVRVDAKGQTSVTEIKDGPRIAIPESWKIGVDEIQRKLESPTKQVFLLGRSRPMLAAWKISTPVRRQLVLLFSDN